MNNLYKPRLEIRPKNLKGLSENQIAQHWKLYEGYVKNVNTLNQKVAELAAKEDFGAEFAELKRRMGFEYNGMILHEHYFEILKPGRPKLGDDAALIKLFKKSFGGFLNWRQEFVAVGKMRGIGWAILYYDPRHALLSNHWIGMHEEGHPAGFRPLLVMDVWEHAYMVDHGADGRAAYIEAFLENVDWPAVEEHLKDAVKTGRGMLAPAEA